MAVDMFLRIDGIDGESKDAKHAGQIDILHFEWGLSQSGTMHMGGGGGTGKANFRDLTCTSYYEKSTPKLMENCATGGHIPTAEFFVRKAGGTQEEYIIYKMTDLLVSMVSVGGSKNSDERFSVTFSLNFAKIETQYKEQKKDGSLEAPINFGYNIETNEKV